MPVKDNNSSPRKSLIYYYIIALVVLMLLNTFLFPSLLSRPVVEVTYDITSKDCRTGEKHSFREVHPMRYFFEAELIKLLTDAGFQKITFEQFLTGNTISENTWGVCCIAQQGRKK